MWTAALAGSLTWNLHLQRSAIHDLVLHTARAYFDKDLVPAVDPTFSGDKTGQYRGMMVLGGD